MSEKKEELDIEHLKGIRYFKVHKDTYLDGVPLKKGDIVRIRNEDISDMYTLDPDFTLECFSDTPVSTIIGEYPENQPITYKSLIEFLKGKKITLDNYSHRVGVDFGYLDGVYLNLELAKKIFADSYHDIELDMWASTRGATYLFPGIPTELAKEKFDIAMSQSDQQSFPMELGDYNRMHVFNAGGITKFAEILPDGAPLEGGNECEIDLLNLGMIRPGFYNTSNRVTVSFYLQEQNIDFNEKPEYLYNFIFKGVLHFLDSSTEIRDREEKQKIYEELNKDAVIVGESVHDAVAKIRYYRVMPGVIIKRDKDYFIKEELAKSKVNGIDTSRIMGDFQVAERNADDRAEVIKIVIREGTEANHAYVTDLEMSKIAYRIPERDCHKIRLREISERKKEFMQEIREKYKIKTPSLDKRNGGALALDPLERMMKLIDIAATRVKRTTLTDSFKKEAEKYYQQNTKNNKGKFSPSKPYYFFRDAYWLVIGNVDIDGIHEPLDFLWDNKGEMESFKYIFYMVHLVEKEFNNPVLSKEHSRLQADARKSLSGVLANYAAKVPKNEGPEDRE